MTTMNVTAHATMRLAQRGMSVSDVELVAEFGTDVGDGRYFLRAKDWQETERQLKRFIDRGRRLVGRVAITSEGRLVTAYCVRRAKERRLLRHAEERALVRGRLHRAHSRGA
jgi:hypothetical protein